MPLYEYVCDDCHARFEKYLRSWGEAVSCPACQGQSVEKQLSRFALAGTGGGSPGSATGGCGCGRGGCGCHG